jgi:hypothetical protein
MTFEGIRASAVPFLLPKPECRPNRLDAWRSLVRAREWTTVGLTMLIISQGLGASVGRPNSHVTVLEELSDTRSRVGLSDLGSLLGVEPDWMSAYGRC